MSIERNKTKKMIMAAIACIVLIVSIMLIASMRTRDGMANSDKKTTLICKNTNCKAVYEVSTTQLDDLLAANNPDGGLVMNPDMKSMTVKCKKCGEKSAQIGMKCKKCGRLFVLNYDATNDYPDRCPSCGYSKLEERRNGTTH